MMDGDVYHAFFFISTIFILSFTRLFTSHDFLHLTLVAVLQ